MQSLQLQAGKGVVLSSVLLQSMNLLTMEHLQGTCGWATENAALWEPEPLFPSVLPRGVTEVHI